MDITFNPSIVFYISESGSDVGEADVVANNVSINEDQHVLQWRDVFADVFQVIEYEEVSKLENETGYKVKMSDNRLIFIKELTATIYHSRVKPQMLEPPEGEMVDSDRVQKFFRCYNPYK